MSQLSVIVQDVISKTRVTSVLKFQGQITSKYSCRTPGNGQQNVSLKEWYSTGVNSPPQNGNVWTFVWLSQVVEKRNVSGI